MAVSRLSQTSLQNAFQKYNTVWDGKSAVGGYESLGTVLFSRFSVLSVVIPLQAVSAITIGITANAFFISAFLCVLLQY
jgi:hypothetical protein